MTSHLLGKLKGKVKKISFKGKIDALRRHTLRFCELNGRDQGKVHGRNTEGYPDGGDSATIDDVLHSMGCDLFGQTRYEIHIQLKEIPDGSKREAKIKEEEES